MIALLSGEVGGSMIILVISILYVKVGWLWVIGVMISKCLCVLLDVPIIGEMAFGFEVVHWYGLWGPKGLSVEIVTWWNREVVKVLHMDAIEKWLEEQGLEPVGGPLEQFVNRFRIDVDKWKKVVKEAHIVINK